MFQFDFNTLRGSDGTKTACRSVMLTGDWGPIRDFASLMAEEPEACYGDTLELLRRADLRIVNLECTLQGNGKPVPKCGPNLLFEERHLPCLKAGGFQIATLGNNHVFDCGPEGFQATCSALKDLNIAYFGAGMDISEAQKPLIYSLGDIRIGFCAFTEGHDLSGAAVNKPGPAPWDPGFVHDQVLELKKTCDIVLVIPHGGIEYSAWPPDYTIDAYRLIADAKPDAIIAHHPHVPQGFEIFNGVPVFYSQGNFLFYQPTNHLYRKQGYLAELEIAKDGLHGFRLHPYGIDNRGTHLLKGAELTAFCGIFREISRPLTEENPYLGYYGALKERWHEGTPAKDLCDDDASFETDPERAAVVWRNRMTTLQHTHLWITMFDRVTRGVIDDAPEWSSKMEREFLQKKI